MIKKIKVYKNIEDIFKETEEEKKNHPIYCFFYDIYWRIYYFVDSIPLRIRTFIQRGKRGWANSDTWGFDYYLAKVISEGVGNLIRYGNHGIHHSKAFKQIKKTFETAKRISEGELIYIPSKDFTWAKYAKRVKEICEEILSN